MLKQIQYFQAVVRCNSFSAAAAECYISQSTISRQVRALERQLGVTLLKRENRRFSLTPAGEHFYRRSLVFMADLERLCRETVMLARGKERPLRAGFLRGYGGAEFQQAVAEFTAQYPDTPIETKTGNHEELYDLLRTDQVDLALNDQRRAFSDAYVNMVLCVADCHIEIPARDPIAGCAYVNVDDLRRTPCILVASKEQQKNEQAYYHEIWGIESNFLFAENLEEARLMVVSGKGFLPIEGGGAPAGFAGTIRRLPLCRNAKPLHRNYCVFWKADRSDPAVEAFAGILKARFAK